MLRTLMSRVACLTLLVGASHANALQPSSSDGIVAPAWSSSDTRAVGEMLAGVWKSGSVAQSDGQGSIGIVMAIAHVNVEGVPDALYVEAAREDAIWQPYRQAIFQVYAYKGGLRLRTYEIRNNPGIKNAIVGFVYAPELMPTLTRDDLIATLDLDLKKSGAGFVGQTPYPYPTGVGGAVEMTSRIELSPTALASIDQGIAADGSIAWGSSEGEKYEFTKIESPVSVTRTPEGVVMITLAKGEGEPLADGQLATVHYTGYIDDGYSFDNSRKRAQPMTFRWPGQMIPGWNLGVAGLKKGERRRVIIPSDLGYGPNGNPQARIPGNARLTFDIECVLLQDAPVQSQPSPSGGH
ncbi:MAG: FKBP-type peptidyl-prolyl cis-trans isomerase [Phycisphaeraceae bacterium]|nr:FKBP-type peptidyl-prolyl cis-trans isomerase [Phycisphaeraceae bacterium]MBX3367781.1 FKBP-type peptidyl-prolyl cis-trans isomerase [Phycisphaeraceae bacterium]